MEINRRELLAGLAGSGCGLAVQEPERANISTSMYIPKAQLVQDRRLLQSFMDEHRFVELVTSFPTLWISHIPVVLDHAAGTNGRISGHIARNNPQKEAFDGQHAAVAVFRGPHGYISPTWFEKKEVVPTWNFAVVHASGRPRQVGDKSRLREILDHLIDSFEKQGGSSYRLSRLPENYVSPLMEGIVGFEMDIELIEGKFKLGQNWNEGDRNSALEHLRQPVMQEPSLRDYTINFLSHTGGK